MLPEVQSLVASAKKEEESKNEGPESGQGNKKHPFAFMKKVVKYFDSEYSFTQFKVTQDYKSEVGFVADDTLGVISADGKF